MLKENPKKTKSVLKPASFILKFFTAIAVVFVLIWFFQLREPAGDRVIISDKTVLVEIADEDAEIQKGLGDRISLADDAGMLFVFQKPLTPGFWMKDMKFPIDVVWIDENLTIVAISPSLAVESYPQSFAPPVPVKYVLEVNSGLSAYNGWLPGDTVEIQLD
jgi:uncharacterized membrane protein (UPF0127 family)